MTPNLSSPSSWIVDKIRNGVWSGVVIALVAVVASDLRGHSVRTPSSCSRGGPSSFLEIGDSPPSLPPFPICLELEQVSFPGNDEEEWMRQGETFPDSVSVDAFPPLKSVYTHTYVSLLTNFFPFFNLEHGADRVVPHRGGGSGSRRTVQWQVQILCILTFTYKVQIQKIIH